MKSWPFADPPNLGVYTLDEILTGGSRVSKVVHDVVGDWQFLDGRELGGRNGALACLEEVVKLEPSISELADLRLGWRAERPSATAPWQREPMYPADWADLVEEAMEYTKQRQAELEETVELGRWERFDYDQKAAELTWSSEGVARVCAEARLVGSLSLSSNTWLWSWANSHVIDEARLNIDWLEAFGQDNGHERLVEAKFTADEFDAWEMAAVACLLLEADGVYRMPSTSVLSFVLLDGVRRLG